MKKIVASVGLVALGASCVQAADESYVSAEAVKPWSISATLRGFYDDNVNNVSSGKEDRFGFIVKPGISLGWQGEQTTVNARYAYSFLYGFTKPARSTSYYDQDHIFSASLSHRFSERYQVQVTDTFVVGQEPDVLRVNDVSAAVQRISGNNIVNLGSITFNAQMTRLFSLQLGYGNALFDYHESGATVLTDASGNIVDVLAVSRSGTLDRMEHSAHVDARWQVTPQTVGLIGYQYAQADFTGDEPLGVLTGLPGSPVLMSNGRNSRSHYGYVGVDHVFTPDIFGSVQGGARYTDSYNDPSGTKNTSPYARASLSYTYAPGSSVQAGFSYDWNATDQIGFSITRDSYTLGSETANVFASLNHRLAPRLYGSISGQLQNSTFVGGSIDGDSQRYYLLGVNLQYRFARHVSAEVGYNFDKVDSDIGLHYDRNRFYVGITGSY